MPGSVVSRLKEGAKKFQLFDQKGEFIEPRFEYGYDSSDSGSCFDDHRDEHDCDGVSDSSSVKYTKKHTHNLVYRRIVFDQPHSPACIYLPSKAVIFKLMRACIGVESPRDLWFN